MPPGQRFLIIFGLPKSGTTFLFNECSKRPDIFAMPRHTKEVDYFRRGKDRDSYLALFENSDNKTVVDSSPLYIDDIVLSASNIKYALAQDSVRIVVCLRDPLERAYSHYLHDVAQHQKILGHADYSFSSPSVFAKYIFPIAPRIRFLLDKFGADNVYSFAFGNAAENLEHLLRDYSGLESDWRLDITDNPAPGFTSPIVYYNARHDMEVSIGGALHLLPKGQLLVVNRQYSILRADIHPQLAEHIVMRQSSITRHFDTGSLGAQARDLLYDDMAEAANLLGMEMQLDRSPRVLQSKPSESVPRHIAAKLPQIGTLDETVVKLMNFELQPTCKSILAMPHVDISLAREMARLQLAAARDQSEKSTCHSLQLGIVDAFGPIPLYMEALLKHSVAHERYDEALLLFDAYGGPRRLLWPMDLAHFLASRQITLPAHVAERFQQAGIRISLPS